MALCFYSHIFNRAAVTFGIESANVVGYQNIETVSGFNFFTPTFNKTGATEKSYNINDIQLDASTATSWTDNIQLLDEGGATVSTYYYVAAGELLADKACWTEDFATAVDFDIEAGTSFILETQAPVIITVSGEVLKGNLTLTSVAGFNFVGNATPSGMNIQGITLDAALATSWTDNIQLLDEGGSTIATYYYVAAGELLADKACWTEDFATAADVEIDAGQGFILETTNGDVTITLPMALAQ